jgi:peroxiredoxin family protein
VSGPAKVAVFLHSGEYDRMHQGLSIAATAAAAGRPAEVFFFWWALERLSKDALDAPDLAREDVADAFERRGIPTLRQLLSHLKETGRCRLYACTGSMGILDLPNSGMSTRVDQLVGWSTILSLTAGVTDRFYL